MAGIYPPEDKCKESILYSKEEGLHKCEKIGSCEYKFPFHIFNFCRIEFERHQKQKELSDKIKAEKILNS